MASLYVRIMIGGVGVFAGGFMAFKYTLIDGSLALLPGLGLGALGIGGGVAIMAIGAWLYNRETS